MYRVYSIEWSEEDGEGEGKRGKVCEIHLLIKSSSFVGVSLHVCVPPLTFIELNLKFFISVVLLFLSQTRCC